MTAKALIGLAAMCACVDASRASAQTVPFIDTEDATLSEVDVGDATVRINVGGHLASQRMS